MSKPISNYLTNFVQENETIVDASFIKKLNRIKIPQRHITRVPGMELILTKRYGKLYGIRYYIVNTSRPDDKVMIRFTSNSASFVQLFSFDVCDKRFNPVYGFMLKENITQEALIKVIKDISDSKEIKRKFLILKSKGYKPSQLLKQLAINPSGLQQEGSTPVWKNPAVMAELIKAGWILFIGLLGAGLTIHAYYRKILHWQEEIKAETTVEKSINKELFSGQTENEKGFDIYANLINFIKQVVDGPFPAVIVCGPPGTSKTYIVRRTFYFMKLKPGAEYVIEKGATIGLMDVFALLYRMKKGILVLDDFDTPLQDSDTVNFLKSITDSYSRRILSMPRVTKIQSGNEVSEYDIPQKFEYEGKLVIVTNLERNKLDKALLSRCPSIEVNFSTQDILKALEKMYKFVRPSVEVSIKREVLDYMIELYQKDKHIELNFRSYQNSVDARIVNPNEWKELVKVIINYKG